MRDQLTSLKHGVLNLILPPTCLGCGREGELICHACRELLPAIKPPICACCGLPLSPGQYCPDCAGTVFVIDGLRAPFRFEGLSREAIHQYKYHNLRSLTPLLAGFLAGYLKHHSLPADVLVPVPLHPHRLKERGYNQSMLLSAELGCLTGMKVVENALIRTLNTPAQAKTTSLAARRAHMTTAFLSRSDTLKGKRILLIDDVATSGATLNGCAAALKQAGALSVWGLTLAREVKTSTFGNPMIKHN